MNTLTFIGGVGLGFTVSSCLFFWVIGMTSKNGMKEKEHLRTLNDRTLQLLAERNEIDRNIAGHLHTLAQCACAGMPSDDNVKPTNLAGANEAAKTARRA